MHINKNLKFTLLLCLHFFTIAAELYTHKHGLQEHDSHFWARAIKDMNDSDTHATAPYTVKTALEILTKACGSDIPDEPVIEAQALLQEDVYLRTNPINQRNFPVDYPGSYFLACSAQGWQPYISFFYNQTNKGYFTQDGTTLDSYLALDNANLIGKIDQLAFGFGAVQLFSLLSQVKIQERRGAIFLGGAGFKGPWYIEGQVPFLYVARNFSLTPEEKRALENELIFGDTDNPLELDNFTRKHLISDQLGLGDARFYLGYQLIEKASLKFLIGGLVTLPTAYPLAKGLYGTHFPKNNNVPFIDFVQLFNLAVDAPEILQQDVVKFLLAALDKLSSNLLQPYLGNNGHLGLGLFFQTAIEATTKLSFKTRTALEYLLPASERRFYLKRKNKAEFGQFNTDTPENCEKAIAFLEQQLINTLFPSVYNTTVFPGFILKFDTFLVADMTPRLKLNVGYDLWWQQQESLGKISSGEIPRYALRSDIANKSSAFQNKIFGLITYTKKGGRYDWCLSFYGDRTFLSSGIGKDFTLGMNFEFLF